MTMHHNNDPRSSRRTSRRAILGSDMRRVHVLYLSIVVFFLVGIHATGFAQASTITLDSLQARIDRGGDTTFIVNFWATWCKPCVAELPYFDKLFRKYGSVPAVVLLVSVDEKKSLKKVASFIKAKGWKPSVLLLDEDKPHLWIDRVDSSWSGAIPATLMVHPRTGQRRFFEQEFHWSSLESTFLAFTEGIMK
jgi:thiol-disulfide isomerase/thioredoxin